MNICCDAEFEEYEGQLIKGPADDYIGCNCYSCKELREMYNEED